MRVDAVVFDTHRDARTGDDRVRRPRVNLVRGRVYPPLTQRVERLELEPVANAIDRLAALPLVRSYVSCHS